MENKTKRVLQYTVVIGTLNIKEDKLKSYIKDAKKGVKIKSVTGVPHFVNYVVNPGTNEVYLNSNLIVLD